MKVSDRKRHKVIVLTVSYAVAIPVSIYVVGLFVGWW